MTTWRAIWLGFLTAAGLQVAAINATRAGAQSPQQNQAGMAPFTIELRCGGAFSGGRSRLPSTKLESSAR
jgi:hypothetical protein